MINMMKSLKHNKIKNTGIIFEVLTTKLVSEIMNGESPPKSLPIIKRHFNQKSILFKELALYKSLANAKNVLDKDVDKFIDLMIESRKRISDVQLKTARYNVIKDIKKIFGDEFLNEEFGAKIKNYKLFASIYKLFEYDAIDNPAQILECRNVLHDNLLNEKVQEINENEWSHLTKDIRHIGFKFLIEKFNKKYDNLTKRQKTILQTLINHPEKLKEHIQKEIKYLCEQLKSVTNLTDDAIKIKISQLPSLLEGININKINDEHIAIVLRTHQLLNELQND